MTELLLKSSKMPNHLPYPDTVQQLGSHLVHTIKILRFGTGRSEQTVKAQIR